MFAVPNMDEWQSVELDTARRMEINGLEAHSVYAVRVRSKSKDGCYGNFSDIKVSKTSKGKLVSYLTFGCKYVRNKMPTISAKRQNGLSIY